MKNDPKSRGSAKDTHYAKLRRSHRDARRAFESDKTNAAPDTVLVYGLHSVRAAIDNQNRTIHRMLATRNALKRLDIASAESLPFEVTIVEPSAIDAELPEDAVHQGAMIEAAPLPQPTLSDLKDSPLLLVLDQITDPHNVGAILRSAVAFGAGAVITTTRNSPGESGALAKAASGALEMMPYVQVVNLAEAITNLQKAGFLAIGLDSEGTADLANSFSGNRIALVLGAEGKGLRQKSRETVNVLARLDVPGRIKSLNVSNAAAVSLYAARLHLDR
ncbi:23S rRNA (guanosine(2251)-2'-O)-methyltransferase RlmB [Hoeflea sp. WL0058]|uniref:23S rRNA (Guanosine(2251)-2'-O)-methyltransferase RlmB n=1 Tax=Flavimaribacter sediminis TaxID=2865987 RepID=A0AAE2ZHF3_9HYPH|nr:23S rRNA (guanosine(2251)-2'-O)-methyltransferase RlmB [Flavimaribacter sediminis]MBW8636724.1 23S rRNA (guanosine(2251)-2'-O)-methyltransferase RlmB [Flavimaribacter sediminis]